jgi:hypothetical protein
MKRTSTATVEVPAQNSTVRTVVRVPPYEGLVAAMELGVRCIEVRERFSVGEEVKFVEDRA